MMSVGSAAIKAPAIRRPKSMPDMEAPSPDRIRVTGAAGLFELPTIVRAKRNSFQIYVNWKMKTTPNIGFESGAIMRR